MVLAVPDIPKMNEATSVGFADAVPSYLAVPIVFGPKKSAELNVLTKVVLDEL